MPYRITSNDSRCDGYAVVKEDDNKIMGCHETREKALRQLRALYASE